MNRRSSGRGKTVSPIEATSIHPCPLSLPLGRKLEPHESKSTDNRCNDGMGRLPQSTQRPRPGTQSSRYISRRGPDTLDSPLFLRDETAARSPRRGAWPRIRRTEVGGLRRSTRPLSRRFAWYVQLASCGGGRRAIARRNQAAVWATVPRSRRRELTGLPRKTMAMASRRYAAIVCLGVRGIRLCQKMLEVRQGAQESRL